MSAVIWAQEPIERCLKYITEETKLLSTCIRGLRTVSGLPHWYEVRADYVSAIKKIDAEFGIESDEEEVNSEVSPEDIELSKSMAAFAQGEIERDFPLLHAHAVVAIWGALETMVEDLLVAWLMNVPEALEIDAVMKLRISMARFLSMRDEDRMRFLVAELQQTNSGKKRGVGRYEALLGIFDLSGEIDPQVTQDLIEMHSTRNVIVHRASIIDREFVDACEWLDRKQGDRIVVTHADYHRFEEATEKYVVCVMNRVLKHFGLPPYVDNSGVDMATSESEVDKAGAA